MVFQVDRELNIDYEYLVEKQIRKYNLSNYSNVSAINNLQVIQKKIQINIAKVEDIKNISNYIKNLVLESWFFNMLLYLWTCIVLIKSDSDTNRGEFNTLHYI